MIKTQTAVRPARTARQQAVHELQRASHQLRAPFAPEDVLWTDKGANGQWMCYTDARAVRARIEQATGGDWDSRIEGVTASGGVLMSLTLFGAITRSEAGSATGFGGDKGTVSDAFKRCGFTFGVGEYLYSMTPKPRPAKLADQGITHAMWYRQQYVESLQSSLLSELGEVPGLEGRIQRIEAEADLDGASWWRARRLIMENRSLCTRAEITRWIAEAGCVDRLDWSVPAQRQAFLDIAEPIWEERRMPDSAWEFDRMADELEAELSARKISRQQDEDAERADGGPDHA